MRRSPHEAVVMREAQRGEVMDCLIMYTLVGLQWFVFTATCYRDSVTSQYKYVWRYFFLCMLFWPLIFILMLLAKHKDFIDSA